MDNDSQVESNKRLGWTITEWLNAYRQQHLDPRQALHALRSRLELQADSAWIRILSPTELDDQLDHLKASDPHVAPLYGVPFVVKDNIDVVGVPTTAGCPAFAYIPSEDATVVAKIRRAGAILIAKTNLDQFATGLVGTRSPFGAVPNSFNPAYVSGGSSSGSSVAVARGIVPFSLGTDTAGSGRVPAGFNNIVGWKPTRGRFSCWGVVPACRSLDCVSIFALTVDDAETVAEVMEGFDPKDCYSRSAPIPKLTFSCFKRFAIPAEPVWFGDSQAEEAWLRCLAQLKNIGVEVVAVDFAPMEALAKLLYGGPWVAERHAAIGEFMVEHANEMNPVVRRIIENAANFTATDAYRAEYRRLDMSRVIHNVMSTVDALLVPTTPCFPTIAAVEAEPVAINSQLGTYTNFVNLADLSALSLPGCLRNDGLPFGITLIADTWSEAALAEFGRRWQAASPWTLGATGRNMTSTSVIQKSIGNTPPAGYVRLAVVGAHMRLLPLNSQLTDRKAIFVETTRTANNYRLFALPGTSPPKPGLIRNKNGGSVIVELWDVPVEHFGSFVQLVPSPLAIGTLILADGQNVKGFICEQSAVTGSAKAMDITRWGGWRAYMKHCSRLKPSTTVKFHTVLIANRGEIAVRIARTLRSMGIRSIAVYSDADRASAHVTAADSAIRLPGSHANETYLNDQLIMAAAIETGAQAIIPGYGFLSENSSFAEKVEAAGLVFIGPTPRQIEQFGLKHTSREIAAREGLPLSVGTGLLVDVKEAIKEAIRIGYPVMLKSTAGGGGIGLMRCNDEAALTQAFESVKRLSEKFFKENGVFLERFVENARHVEVQIFGDGLGNVVALGERDCSLQRRNQKVVEETPAPDLPSATRQRLLDASVRLGKAVAYRSAGTIEYIYDSSRDEFYFMEVNSRLQVEHTVTEEVTGIDIVEWMVRTAESDPPDLNATVPVSHGASIEVRLYSEDPVRDFQPSPGVLTEVKFPPESDARVDTWVSTGTDVSSYYDSMLAKIIVHGANRSEAITKMRSALDSTRTAGIATNLDYLRQVVASKFFMDGKVSTSALSNFKYVPPVIEVVEPGTFTTVQDYPGRVGYWRVGVPPSGPMDDYAFRLANRILGNNPDAAALEITLIGPKLRFHCSAVIALTGGSSQAKLDGISVESWQPVPVRAGQVLDVGKAETGCRLYMAVQNGFDVPLYLGSRSTFVVGKFGGHGGRTLHASDMLNITLEQHSRKTSGVISASTVLRDGLIPKYPTDGRWTIGVLYGPHGAPDFFTEDSIDMFFSTDWEVHYNSNRLGIRLNGPKPTWPRSDGGEGGLHPSNIHDTEYAMGSVNFTGDMPIILTQDGPSLGGFVCPATIVKAEMWKVGQVKPGEKIRFKCLTFDQALALEIAADAAISKLSPPATVHLDDISPKSTLCVLASLEANASRPEVAYRQAGDKYILVEYGPMVLDLRLRFRVHALTEALTQASIEGVGELSPGVRSLQILFDGRVIHQKRLLELLLKIEETLPSVESMVVPSRVVHLPMTFDDSGTLAAIARYRQSVRNTAPWLPSNSEFIRRINGLDSVDQVRELIYRASYMVLGLGDVYLGAPCAVPVDPRHRLITSKYNPARTYTAEGTVGIGGVYMCIYGMDSPGGYQLVGRTLPIWNKFVKSKAFDNGEPWLLKFFDRVQFYPVDEEELTAQREMFAEGRLDIRIEDDEVFRLADYERFLKDHATSIEEFRKKQKIAFNQEVALWQETGSDPAPLENADSSSPGCFSAEDEELTTAGDHLVRAEMSGNVWKVLVEVGQSVQVDQKLVIIEAMKMEFNISADRVGKIRSIRCTTGKPVNNGDILVIITPD